MSTKLLDHIVHLTPPNSIPETIKQWEKLGFTVITGGTHADGLTANALVILSDTTYLELIAFTHPADYYPPGSPERVKRDSHPWAGKSPGWIDFAFLGFGVSNPYVRPTGMDDKKNEKEKEVDLADVINGRAEADGSGARYARTVPGGRTRPDGRELRWKITAPDAERHGRGTLPFFCGDVTERGWRVPVSDETTVHPNTAKSVTYIRLLSAASSFSSFSKQLQSVLGVPPTASTDTEVSWDLDVPTLPSGGGGAESSAASDPNAPVAQTRSPRLILGVAVSEPENEFLGKNANGFGIYEIAFWVEKAHEGASHSPFGRVRWVAME